MIKETNDPNGSAPRTADDGVFDVVVVGAGAAGLNAALLLGRARRKVVVKDAASRATRPPRATATVRRAETTDI